MIKRPRLWAAFKMIDKDESGKISYDEVKEMLSMGQNAFSETEFNETVKQIDIDGDGQIDFNEFEKMMQILV